MIGAQPARETADKNQQIIVQRKRFNVRNNDCPDLTSPYNRTVNLSGAWMAIHLHAIADVLLSPCVGLDTRLLPRSYG